MDRAPARLGRMRLLRRNRHPLQRDCVLALSRGGRYTLDNIVPVCGPCNTSKCNDEVTSWLRRKRLNEGSFLLRYSQIKKTLALHFASKLDGPAD